MARIVEGHVQAKRYLTFKYPYYYNALSESSKRTLSEQGGRMTADEARDFENDPLFDLMILMRKWDEMAKMISAPLMSLDELKARAIRVLSSVPVPV